MDVKPLDDVARVCDNDVVTTTPGYEAAIADALAAARKAHARWDRAQLSGRRGSKEYREAFAEARRTDRALYEAKVKYHKRGGVHRV